ncbi:MAG: 50S ribosomal protein L17 [Patescibacteria group bacterium]|nr:50S ribosomal protein L17 [Patescibacteria group bacterium]MDE1945912.1 50S ribosomal protein L17 [Patescibacteria group bacterium]
MLHRNKNKQFGRKRNVRNALVRTLAVSLIRDGHMKTTETKAKAIRSVVEKLVTKGKSGTLAAQRLIASTVGARMAAKVVKEISPKYKDRAGGYTRVVKLGRRLSDGASMAEIAFI